MNDVLRMGVAERLRHLSQPRRDLGDDSSLTDEMLQIPAGQLHGEEAASSGRPTAAGNRHDVGVMQAGDQRKFINKPLDCGRLREE